MNLLHRLGLLALAATSLLAVAEELPGQQIRGPEDWLYLAFGSGTQHSNARIDVSAQAKERHELRCCTRTERSGWLRSNNACNVWHESDKLVGLDGTMQCFHAVNYTEAQAICTANNAYVCTKEEVESGCARGMPLLWSYCSVFLIGCLTRPVPSFYTFPVGSGCSHDSDWIWTSTAPPPRTEAGSNGDPHCKSLYGVVLLTDKWTGDLTNVFLFSTL